MVCFVSVLHTLWNLFSSIVSLVSRALWVVCLIRYFVSISRTLNGLFNSIFVSILRPLNGLLKWIVSLVSSAIWMVSLARLCVSVCARLELSLIWLPRGHLLHFKDYFLFDFVFSIHCTPRIHSSWIISLVCRSLFVVSLVVSLYDP